LVLVYIFLFLLRFQGDLLVFLFVAHVAWLRGEEETGLFVFCLGDRQEVHPSRPHTSHLLSLWCTSGGLALYFSGKTSNINGVLKKICLAFCIKHGLRSIYAALCELNTSTSIDRLGNRQSLRGFTFSSYETRGWSLILMGLILGRKDGDGVKVNERREKEQKWRWRPPPTGSCSSWWEEENLKIHIYCQLKDICLSSFPPS